MERKKLTLEEQQDIASLECLIANQIALIRLDALQALGGSTRRTKQHINNASKHIRVTLGSRVDKLDSHRLEAFDYLYEGADNYVHTLARLNPELQIKIAETFKGDSIELIRFFKLGFELLKNTIKLEDRKYLNQVQKDLEKIIDRQ